MAFCRISLKSCKFWIIKPIDERKYTRHAWKKVTSEFNLAYFIKGIEWRVKVAQCYVWNVKVDIWINAKYLFYLKAEDGCGGQRKRGEEDGQGFGGNSETTGEVILMTFCYLHLQLSMAGRRREKPRGCARWDWRRRRRWRRRLASRSESFWSPRGSWSPSACWTSCWSESRWRAGPSSNFTFQLGLDLSQRRVTTGGVIKTLIHILSTPGTWGGCLLSLKDVKHHLLFFILKAGKICHDQPRKPLAVSAYRLVSPDIS